MQGFLQILAILIVYVNAAAAESFSDTTHKTLDQTKQITEHNGKSIEINPFFIREADAPAECLYESSRVCDYLGCFIEQMYVHKPCLVEEQLKKTLSLLKIYSQDASKENLSKLRLEILQLSFMAEGNGLHLDTVLNSNAELFDTLNSIKKWVSSIETADADLLYQLDLHNGEHTAVERFIRSIDIELSDELRNYSTGEKQVNNIRMPTLIQRISADTGVDGDIITTLQIIEAYFNSLPLVDRKEVQLVLKARGLYSSSIDGVWGQQTRIAFAVYLSPIMEASLASSLKELFDEIKTGFVIENLWLREDYEQEVKSIYSSSRKIITLEPRSPSRTTGKNDADFKLPKIPNSDTTYRRSGNNIFGSDGSSYRRVGKTIFGSDGTSCRQVGNNLFCN